MQVIEQAGDIPKIIGIDLTRAMIRIYWGITRKHVIAYKYYEDYTRGTVKTQPCKEPEK